FPPPPSSPALRHKIITDMCVNFSATAFEDVGCAVCGQLVPRSEATPKDDVMVDWDLLCRDGVTRKERTKYSQPIESLSGPVVDERCTHVCLKCEKALRRKRAPTHALANGLWIGHVPWQLRDLSFAERILIAKVRHNRCVVRVASGRGKLMGNVVMFESPVAKVYNT
ncbi:hypothetical protein K438DRAFT_1514527, partial [Mycena galopus ATCC 62051]